MKTDEDLTGVGRVTRRQLRHAFVSRFTARVWDSHDSDPSFFREAAVVLVPPFSSGKHLDMLKLKDGDGEHLPASKVEAKRDEVRHEIRHRAIQAATALAAKSEDMAVAREAKQSERRCPPLLLLQPLGRMTPHGRWSNTTRATVWHRTRQKLWMQGL